MSITDQALAFETDSEFDFQVGDIIAVTHTPPDGWWSGKLIAPLPRDKRADFSRSIRRTSRRGSSTTREDRFPEQFVRVDTESFAECSMTNASSVPITACACSRKAIQRRIIPSNLKEPCL
jgi:hypothetical protein